MHLVLALTTKTSHSTLYCAECDRQHKGRRFPCPAAFFPHLSINNNDSVQRSAFLSVLTLIPWVHRLLSLRIWHIIRPKQIDFQTLKGWKSPQIYYHLAHIIIFYDCKFSIWLLHIVVIIIKLLLLVVVLFTYWNSKDSEKLNIWPPNESLQPWTSLFF